MRMKLPGTSPPNVQKKYSTPSAILFTTSRTSSFTRTFVAWVRLMGGGTWGACVSTAVSSPMTLESTPFAPGPLGKVRSGSAADEGDAAQKATAIKRTVWCSGLSDDFVFMRLGLNRAAPPG